MVEEKQKDNYVIVGSDGKMLTRNVELLKPAPFSEQQSLLQPPTTVELKAKRVSREARDSQIQNLPLWGEIMERQESRGAPGEEEELAPDTQGEEGSEMEEGEDSDSTGNGRGAGSSIPSGPMHTLTPGQRRPSKRPRDSHTPEG